MAIVLSLAFPVFSQGAIISGTVFVDLDGDGVVDQGSDGDWGVRSDPIQLFDQNNQLLKEVWTDIYGYYSFTDLPVGTYTVKNTVPCFLGNVAYVGKTLRANNILKDNGQADSAAVIISNINLQANDIAYSYNFANDEYPMQLYSKIMLIADSDYQVQTVPEPASIASLLAMVMTAGGWAFCRRRRQ